jgi:hypothetical protein
MERLWGLLHLFFAFSFVGGLVVAEWNGRMARVVSDWHQRALLFGIVHRSTRLTGIWALLLVGVFGHGWAVPLHWKMGAERWMQVSTTVWLVLLLLMAFVVAPAAARLEKLAREAAAGGGGEGWDRALSRWRLGNAAASGLYLAMLALMVFRWRS